MVQAEQSPRETEPRRSNRGVFLILAGIILTGLIAGYRWLKELAKYRS